MFLEAFLSEFYFPSYIKPDFDFIKLMCELKNKKLVQKSAWGMCRCTVCSSALPVCFACLKLILVAVLQYSVIILGLQHAQQLSVGKTSIQFSRPELVFQFMKMKCLVAVWPSTPCSQRNRSWGFLSRTYLSNSELSKTFSSSFTWYKI